MPRKMMVGPSTLGAALLAAAFSLMAIGCAKAPNEHDVAMEQVREALEQGNTARAQQIIRNLNGDNSSSDEARALAEKTKQLAEEEDRKEIAKLKSEYTAAIKHADFPVAHDKLNRSIQIASRLNSKELLELRADQKRLNDLTDARVYVDFLRKADYQELLQYQADQTGSEKVFDDPEMNKIFWNVLVNKYVDKEITHRNGERSQAIHRADSASRFAYVSEQRRIMQEHQRAAKQLAQSIRRATPEEKLTLLKGLQLLHTIAPSKDPEPQPDELLRRFEEGLDKHGVAAIKGYRLLCQYAPNILIIRDDGKMFTLGMQQEQLYSVVPEPLLQSAEAPVSKSRRKIPDVEPANVDSILFAEVVQTFGYTGEAPP